MHDVNCILTIANSNMEHLFTSESIISFFILVVLEVVLGIDNVIFVSIILNRLKIEKEQAKARRFWMIYWHHSAKPIADGTWLAAGAKRKIHLHYCR